jgi:hypothetical protein
MLINKDEKNDHSVRVSFSDSATKQARFFMGTVDRIVFGSAEYQWHPDPAPPADVARASVQAAGDGQEGDAPPGPGRAREYGHGDPDGPASRSTVMADGPDTLYNLPKASIIVLRGSLNR